MEYNTVLGFMWFLFLAIVLTQVVIDISLVPHFLMVEAHSPSTVTIFSTLFTIFFLSLFVLEVEDVNIPT